MRRLSDETRKRIDTDLFYRRCCLYDKTCSGPLQQHHNLIYAGRQVDDFWAILPLCQSHHEVADRKDVKKKLNAIMLSRASGGHVEYEKVRRIKV